MAKRKKHCLAFTSIDMLYVQTIQTHARARTHTHTCTHLNSLFYNSFSYNYNPKFSVHSTLLPMLLMKNADLFLTCCYVKSYSLYCGKIAP